MFTRKRKKFLPTYLYLVGNFLVICWASSAVINFTMLLALDFSQLLDALGNGLDFHINIEQCLKTLVNGFLDLLLSTFSFAKYTFIVLIAIIACT